MYGREYVDALMNGDQKTQRAIERLNQDKYPPTREGNNQEIRDRIRATFGEAYESYWESY